MSENEKPYRISISFPTEMADIIWAYAKEDERTFTWEVTHLIQELFKEREYGNRARPYPDHSRLDAMDKHQRLVKQIQEQKEAQV